MEVDAGAMALLIALLIALLVHPATSHCVPRSPTAHPIYPFLGRHRHRPSAPHPSHSAAVPPAASAAVPPAVSGPVRSICNGTDNPELCLSAIRAEIPGLLGRVDAAAVLSLQMKACARQTQEARALAEKIAGDPITGKMKASIMQVCTDSYDDALDNLDAAAKAMASHDKNTMNSMLSAVLTDYSTCEEGFMETPGIHSPMTHYDDVLQKLASNCLALTQLLD